MILLLILPAMLLVYLDLFELGEVDREWRNKVEKVSQAIQSDQVKEKEEFNVDDIEEAIDHPESEVKKLDKEDGGIKNLEEEKVEAKEDEWVEDKDQKEMMDAKVMRRGDKKLIIVDMPDPGRMWRKPK